MLLLILLLLRYGMKEPCRKRKLEGLRPPLRYRTMPATATITVTVCVTVTVTVC